MKVKKKKKKTIETGKRPSRRIIQIRLDRKADANPQC